MVTRRIAVLQGAISLVSLTAVVWWASRQDRPSLPETGDAVAALLAAGGLYAAATAARAERWYRILRRSGVGARRGDAYGLTTVGYMANNVLPARSGDLLRALLLVPATGTGKRSAVGTVVAERVLDVVALGLMFLALAYGFLRGVPVPGVLFLVAAAGAFALAVAVAAVVALRRGDLVRRAREFMRPLAAASRDLLSAHGAALLLLSLAIWALEGSVYLAVARAVGLEMGPLEAAYVVAFTNLFAMVPAAPGYLGTFDAAVVFAAKSIGGPGYLVVTYLLLLRFVLFVPITVVGLVVLIARYGGWSRYRDARLEAMRA
ncbi:MAG TPA: lysylphosphatidylglycerol synthase transmembrane domain-containing protein [Gaiellaceae bacterium]|nr:lysylphosphatidylglycerol synthase transmembrane domain-containing protein [Gaiellaceae bacterium]